MNWWLAAMKKYIDFSGRARRKEYWMFILFNLIFGVVALILDFTLGSINENLGYGLFYSLFSLGIILPTWSVTIRRLHDVGKSGWWIFIGLLPFIGGIWLFILTITDGQANSNRYGTNPKLAV